MKLSVDTLKDALKVLKPVTRKNHFLPMTRITVDYEAPYETRLTATNGDVWLTATLDGEAGPESQTFLLDPKELEACINQDARSLFLTPDLEHPEQLLVTDDRGGWSTSITRYHVDDVPPAPDSTKSSHLFSLFEDGWNDLARIVVPSVAPDESRPVLSGVHFSKAPGQADVIATAADGFRLTTHRLTEGVYEFEPFILPRSAIKLIPWKVRAIGFAQIEGQRGYLGIEFNTQRTRSSHIIDYAMVARLIEGQFPDYRQIIPTEEQITGACWIPFWIVEEAAKVKDGTVLIFAPGTAELLRSEGKPQNWSSVAISFHPHAGQTFDSCAFNPTYLHDLMVAMGSPNVVELKAGTSGAYLADNGRTQSVVMAMVTPQNSFKRNEPAVEAAAD